MVWCLAQGQFYHYLYNAKVYKPKQEISRCINNQHLRINFIDRDLTLKWTDYWPKHVGDDITIQVYQ
jgi:mRNA-degrading endonuclease YafQ of YafQ-DinJ toxin-antitoxin module